MKKTNDQHLKRVIVDFKKLNKDILDLLVTKYPDGFGDDDIISFKNQNNETIECVEVKTEDTKYLVKFSTRLVTVMQDHDMEEEERYEDEENTEDMEIDPEFPKE